MCASPPVRHPLSGRAWTLDTYSRTFVYEYASHPHLHLGFTSRDFIFLFLFRRCPCALGRSCVHRYAPSPGTRALGARAAYAQRAAGTLLAAARVSRLVERVGGERRAGHEEPPRERVHLETGVPTVSHCPPQHTQAQYTTVHILYVTRVVSRTRYEYLTCQTRAQGTFACYSGKKRKAECANGTRLRGDVRGGELSEMDDMLFSALRSEMAGPAREAAGACRRPSGAPPKAALRRQYRERCGAGRPVIDTGCFGSFGSDHGPAGMDSESPLSAAMRDHFPADLSGFDSGPGRHRDGRGHRDRHQDAFDPDMMRRILRQQQRDTERERQRQQQEDDFEKERMRREIERLRAISRPSVSA